MENVNVQYRDNKVIDRTKKIKHKIAVMSNKGGVGKSTISVNMAMSLHSKGFRVGLLDADLHGPSVFKMLGIEGQKIMAMEDQILPKTAKGIKVISMAGLIKDSSEPVIWRGPLKMKIVKDFLSNVHWEDLDFLVIDLPPGTGDETLSICQLIPELEGFVIVTTPQEMATLDTQKSLSFASQVNIPVIGVIENMSSMVCPHCNKSVDIFGKGGGKKMAQKFDVQFLGELSFDPNIVINADNGKTILCDNNENIRKQFQDIMYNIEYFVENKI
ncbi:MAG: Mrp/NBP35 family ATP-binding protein [Candidatus Omnitrophica bacterium]|nr:Mrp/NBP35 family ATP-binding protein [Candidatus Omnitrophota bacterium]